MTDSNPRHLVEIGSGGLRASINLDGAELWRLIDHDGVDLLWSGDSQFWSGRSPVLFPIIGSLAGGNYRYKDERYPLGRHGFARHSRFSMIACSADSVLLRLDADEDSRVIYPFEFQLDLRFTCSVAALEVAVSVSNLGNDRMPFSFGFHPALRWPLEPTMDRADHAIRFARPELSPISRLDPEGLILPGREPSPVEAGELVLQDDLFTADALVFTDLVSRSVEYGPRGQPGRRIRVDFDNLPLLGVWTKPGAGFICIEPWQGMADPQGFDGDIFAKPGMLVLPPDATWTGNMVLTVVMP